MCYADGSQLLQGYLSYLQVSAIQAEPSRVVWRFRVGLSNCGGVEEHVRHCRLWCWQAGQMHGASGIDHERTVLAEKLAGLAGAALAAAERAIVLFHERHPPGRRNLVSVLATVGS